LNPHKYVSSAIKVCVTLRVDTNYNNLHTRTFSNSSNTRPRAACTQFNETFASCFIYLTFLSTTHFFNLILTNYSLSKKAVSLEGSPPLLTHISSFNFFLLLSFPCLSFLSAAHPRVYIPLEFRGILDQSIIPVVKYTGMVFAVIYIHAPQKHVPFLQESSLPSFH
jgi:hypothetical protein